MSTKLKRYAVDPQTLDLAKHFLSEGGRTRFEVQQAWELANAIQLAAENWIAINVGTEVE